MQIEVNDILHLKGLDSEETLKEKVTSIENPESNEEFFQICTENLAYDFQNFFEIVRIEKRQARTGHVSKNE